MGGSGVSGSRFEEVRPEPARFWVRWAPRGWPGPRQPFLDLARGRLAPRALRHGEPPGVLPEKPPDTLYLPPVRRDAAAWRDEWLERAREAGCPTVVQVTAGEEPPTEATAPVVDLTAALLGRDLALLDAIPGGATAVWPLLRGLTDGEELVATGCDRLRAAGVRAVQGVVPELTPAERRRLSRRGGEEVYQALFHGPPPSPLGLARAVAGNGLSPWFSRPEVAEPGRRARNRALAGHLATLAEWRLLLGCPEGGAQALFRAARWIEHEPRDVAAIAAEGNLSIVDWLEDSCRREIERFAAAGAEQAIAELTAELLATPDPTRSR